MKYKHIAAAIHNFGHSYVSFMNYIDGDLIINDLRNIHRKDYDISINYLTREFQPVQLLNDRISKSIDLAADSLPEHLLKHNIDPQSIQSLSLVWPVNELHYIVATDDRGNDYKKVIQYAK